MLIASLQLASLICNVVNPILLVMILEEPLIAEGEGRGKCWRVLCFWGKAVLGIAIAVILAELGKAFEVWAGHPRFPSGHTTFAVSAATCLILRRGTRWAFLVVPLAVLMMSSLPYANYHTWDEVAGGTVLGVTIPLLVWRFTRPARTAAA